MSLRLRGSDGPAIGGALVLRLLSAASPATQCEVAALLLVLLEANPANKRTLCLWYGLGPLLCAAARCADDETGGALRLHYLRLAASLGEHSVPPADALLLLRLAAAPRHQLLQHQHGSQAAEASGRAGESSGPAQEDSQRGPAAEDSQRWAELQMQMLFVLGVIAERAAPPAFFSFDGSGVLPLPPLAHFPPAKTGFTLSFWLRLGAQPADEPEVSSPISPPYLPYISPISPLYLHYISPTSRSPRTSRR